MATYILEPIVGKIKAPIVCETENQDYKFASGKELSVYSFEKPYLIDVIKINDGAVVITLKEHSESDEKWIKEHIETYGHEPNMFDGA